MRHTSLPSLRSLGLFLLVASACACHVNARAGGELAVATPSQNAIRLGPGTSSVLFRGARVFDGVDACEACEREDVLVVDAKIVARGKSLAVLENANGAFEEIDARGKTLLPGFIDAHTHQSGNEAYLAESVAFGITTEVDTGGTSIARLKEIRAKADPKLADMIGAGTWITAPGGHGTWRPETPTLARAEDARAFVDARANEGSEFIKLILASEAPTLSAETARAVVVAAHARGLQVVSHVTKRNDADTALAAGVDGFAHLFVNPFEGGWDAVAAQQTIEGIGRSGAFVVPTLQMLQGSCGISGGRALLSDARIAPRLSESAKKRLAVSAWNDDPAPHCYGHVKESMRMLHALSVPILAGTDAPNDGTTHGAGMHRELELLVDAGLTPVEALRAATSAPAKAFKLADRGRIAPGLRADLLLVEGDPTKNILATRAIARVYHRGVRTL